jgi:hypothetical protein
LLSLFWRAAGAEDSWDSFQEIPKMNSRITLLLTKEPVTGQIDRATQRVAFHLGNNTDSVIEAGAYNLTQDVASCKVYFGKANPQTWLLVRLPTPKMPDAPTPVAVQSTPAPTGDAGATTSIVGSQN